MWTAQIKKKMTKDEFIRNNRGINDNKDLPRVCSRCLYALVSSGVAGVP